MKSPHLKVLLVSTALVFANVSSAEDQAPTQTAATEATLTARLESETQELFRNAVATKIEITITEGETCRSLRASFIAYRTEPREIRLSIAKDTTNQGEITLQGNCFVVPKGLGIEITSFVFTEPHLAFAGVSGVATLEGDTALYSDGNRSLTVKLLSMTPLR
jgi:hypothetical protein